MEFSRWFSNKNECCVIDDNNLL